MHLFFAEDIISDSYTLDEKESKHCIKVLRLKKGDTIQLLNGKGSLFTAVISDDNPKRCQLNITDEERKEQRKDHTLIIAIAPTKSNDRFETFLEKCTEIGIDKIIPFTSRYSERKKINHDRCEKIIISAVKQSKAFFKPGFERLLNFKELLNTDFEGEKYIAHCYDSDNKKQVKNIYTKGNDVMILIGPEGDFSEEEVKQAIEHGFTEISLSDARLRTETAGIVACTMIGFLNR